MIDECECKKKRGEKCTKDSLSTKLRTVILWSKKAAEDLIARDRQRERKSRGDKNPANVLSSFNRDYRADLMHFAGPFALSYGSIFNYSLPLRGPP